MQTGKRDPLQLPQNEQYNQLTTQFISGKLILTQDKFLFPALNSSNAFATIDYEAHINTENDYSINLFKLCLLLKSILSIIFVKSNVLNF